MWACPTARRPARRSRPRARPPIDLEARCTVIGSRTLATLSELLRAIDPPAERRVALDLFSFEPRPLLELLGSCDHEVRLAIGGGERSPGVSMRVTLERSEVTGLAVGVEIDVPGGLAQASDDARCAVLDCLRECRRQGVLRIDDEPARIVERFLAAAQGEEAHRALALGVQQSGYRLICRSWRGSEPVVLTIVPDEPIAPDAASLLALWAEPGLWVRGHLCGRDSIATAASIERLAACEADRGAFLELELAVCGEPELDALLDATSEEPIVVEWRCGFDAWGPAYHGVRLALHGRYQDGRVVPEPGRNEVVVLVDAKRRDPTADEVAASLASRAGLALERAGAGL